MDEHILVLSGSQGEGEVTETAHHAQDVMLGGPIIHLASPTRGTTFSLTVKQLGNEATTLDA